MDVVLKLELPEDLERNVRSIVTNVGLIAQFMEKIMDALEALKAEVATLKTDVAQQLAKYADAVTKLQTPGISADEVAAVAADIHAVNQTLEAAVAPPPGNPVT